MAEVTGPISSLPGSGHALPEGTKCDNHPDRPAVARIQGETDSFGCEMNDLCQECLDADRAYERSEEARTGRCDWCKKPSTDLRWKRDHEEGLHGPVYHVCGACAKAYDAEKEDELAYWDEPSGWDGE